MCLFSYVQLHTCRVLDIGYVDTLGRQCSSLFRNGRGVFGEKKIRKGPIVDRN